METRPSHLESYDEFLARTGMPAGEDSFVLYILQCMGGIACAFLFSQVRTDRHRISHQQSLSTLESYLSL